MTFAIKICGLRTAADVAAAVAAGADAVGFVFAESVRRVTPDEARNAAAAVPEGVLRVAVMKHPDPAEWLAVLDGFAPDVLQTDSEDFAHLNVPAALRRWPVYREGGIDDATRLPDEFLYEGRQSGAGATVDWDLAAAIARRGNMILAGGLTPANVGAAVAAVRPRGVDVSSGVESAPGVKDPARIREFISAARAAEQKQ